MQAVKDLDLKKEIAELKTQIEIAHTIKDMIGKFNHYKQVNKRFVDAIKELPGYHASLYDYNGGKKLYVSFNHCSVEVYDYGKDLTWGSILSNIPDYEHWLKQAEQKLSCLDEDIKTLKEIYDFMRTKSTKNFYLSTMINELESAYLCSGRFRKAYICNNWKCNKEHSQDKEGTWCAACDEGYIRDKLIKVGS